MSSSVRKKQLKSLKSPNKLSLTGITQDFYLVSEQKEITEDIENLTLSLNSQINTLINNLTEDLSATVESQHHLKKKIWKDKLISSEETTLTTKLLETLDLVSTSKEKVLTPFWTSQSLEISKKLWLPTKIDSVDSVLTSTSELSENTLMGKSWFSIKKKHLQQKNSLMTSFQLSQFSLQDSMVSEVTNLKTKSKKKPLRTLKMRLFPTKEEKEKIKHSLEEYRWYYNATVAIMNKKYSLEELVKEEQWSNTFIRDKIMRKYKYVESKDSNGRIIKDFIYDEHRDEVPKPDWWTQKIHSRIPRGASDKYTSSLNSAISNFRNKNISKFKMTYKTKKDPIYYMHLEDSSFPSFIKEIKSKYWFRTKDRKRKYISFQDIFESGTTPKKGLEIIFDRINNKYFLHYPVEQDWFPKDDLRVENQDKLNINKKRILSLDPGVRKFLVGFDPTGESIFIGENAQKHLLPLLLEIDTIKNKKQEFNKWKKIKNLVNELHWKTIHFLIKEYDIILLPDFRVSEMVRSKKLDRKTKRLMTMFSFFSFKEKLIYQCKRYNKKLLIVDESYTSCTCGCCGEINRELKGREIFDCKKCNIKLDRDASGSRNILLKNIQLKSN